MPSVKLSPIGNDQVVTHTGAPASGWYWATFAAGSSTPQTTYTSAAGTVPQAAEIVLNADGVPGNPIWLVAGLAYKFVLYDDQDVSQRTVDNVVGINDTSVSIAQWVATGAVPTYISANQFSLVGDQTSEFHVGRRVQLVDTSGTDYGTITASAYTTLTTVTVELDSGALDSGLSAVNLSILRADHQAIPTPSTQDIVLAAGKKIVFEGATDDAHELTIDPGDPTGDRTLTAPDKSGTLAITSDLLFVPVRQTVLSGPVDSSGAASFGGSTGSTTVTASGTLIATAANGFSAQGAVNRIGSITDPSWTGLNTNGTMYLYLDIAADGTCTAGSTTLAPDYKQGNSYSTTNGQFTFSLSEMVGKVGNGSAAVQTYRVFVGQVTVTSNVVSAITWYAICGRYDSGWFAVSASTTHAKSHNLGVAPTRFHSWASDSGQVNEGQWMYASSTSGSPLGGAWITQPSRTTISLSTDTAPRFVNNSSPPVVVSATSARMIVERGW